MERSRDAHNSSNVSKPSAPDKWSTNNRENEMSYTPEMTFDQKSTTEAAVSPQKTVEAYGLPTINKDLPV